ncbi:MAG: hypothetical protein KatS3mg013_0808 [Actinomycetota bacterium]|jgi:hypothetical protein|nr:MAG: hypothetical protein KatS3mg013_0808 [Actinomycetota bacterium]
MSSLTLSALCSDDPIAFLAALGIVEVLRSEAGVPDEDLRLGWEAVGGPALLETPFPTVDALIQALQEAAEQMQRDDRPVPARLADLVPRIYTDKERSEIERMTGVKPPFDAVRTSRRAWTERVAQVAWTTSRTDLRWLCALVDQCSTFPGEETAHVTPLYAPVGRQRMRQIYETKLRAVVGDPDLLRQACLMWRRNPNDAGANLDRRAVRDGAVTADGEPRNAAVTGAEWLALQSAPWFRLGGARGRPTAWGWTATGRRGRPRALLWPVWRQGLDPAAIEVILTHPLVRRAGERRGATEALRALGVVAVLRADRATLTNSDGPLGPAQVLWPRTE